MAEQYVKGVMLYQGELVELVVVAAAFVELGQSEVSKEH
jgi:hypothetical protein